MARDESARQRLIDDAMARTSGDVPGVAVQLWRSLALHLASIIGEKGFQLLYTRNLHLANEHFPWLPPGDVSHPIDFQFRNLKKSLEEKSPFEAGEASQALLQSFVNLLVSLIGEPVTMTILRSAWTENVSERGTTGKEHPHE